jgi:hypothetical protein
LSGSDETQKGTYDEILTAVSGASGNQIEFHFKITAIAC